jgi:hypothetical protein
VQALLEAEAAEKARESAADNVGQSVSVGWPTCAGILKTKANRLPQQRAEAAAASERRRATTAELRRTEAELAGLCRTRRSLSYGPPQRWAVAVMSETFDRRSGVSGEYRLRVIVLARKSRLPISQTDCRKRAVRLMRIPKSCPS